MSINWISVEDRLPEEGVEVFVWAEAQWGGVGSRSGDMWHDPECQQIYVTHWAEITGPCEGGDESE